MRCGRCVLLGIPPGAGAAVPYAALGDSYSSGVGAGAYLGGSDCRRSANAYPARVASRLGARLTFAACSGARVSDVVGQLGRVGAETRYVTVSAGGNDAGFADVLLECAKPWPWNCSGRSRGRRRTSGRSFPPGSTSSTRGSGRARLPLASWWSVTRGSSSQATAAGPAPGSRRRRSVTSTALPTC